MKNSIAKGLHTTTNDPAVADQLNNILYGTTAPDGTRTTPGLWDNASERFIDANVKPGIAVNTLTPTAEDSRVFTQTEIKKLLQSGTPTIDGVPKALLQAVYDQTKATSLTAGKSAAEAESAAVKATQQSIRSASFDKSLDIQYAKNPTSGAITHVDTGDRFFSNVEHAPPRTPIADTVPGKTSISDNLGHLTDTHWNDLIEGSNNIARTKGIDLHTINLGDMSADAIAAKDIRTVAADLAHGGVKGLVAAGIVGDVVGLYLAGSQAQAAYGRGDINGAAKIIADYAAGTVGGLVVGGLAVAAVAAALPAAGVAATIAAFTAGLAGAVGGDFAGRAALDGLLQKANDLGIAPPGGVEGIAHDYAWAFKNPGAIAGELSSWLTDVLSNWQMAISNQPPLPPSPLVLDIDGQGGVELTALKGTGAAPVYFDMDNDGFREATGWVTGGDGLLCIDRNGNGAIDGKAELFGDTPAAANGFVALDAYDTNNDDRITSADAQFGALRVWIDANGDGQSQAAELKTLASLGITSISTRWANVNYQVAGNTILQDGTFVMNGQTRKIADAWFAVDQINSQYAGRYTLDARTLFLPDMRGYGSLKDLHIAMSMDQTLLQMVQAVAMKGENDLRSGSFNFKAQIEAIMYQWAGVQAIDPNSGPAGIDARKLGFLEALMGSRFPLINPADLGAASIYMNNAWQQAFIHAFNVILNQSAMASLAVDGAGHYDLSADTLDHTVQFVAGTAAKDQFSMGSAGIAAGYDGDDRIFGSEGGDVLFGGNGSDELYGNGGNDRLYGDAGADSLSGGTGDDTLDGAGDNDSLWGGDGRDSLSGGGGDDALTGDAGSDVLDGGTGADTLKGGADDDTYVFRAGDSPIASGGDTIWEEVSGGVDTIAFKGGIRPDDVRITVDPLGWLTIQYSPTDRVMSNATETIGSTTYMRPSAIERIVFDDGTVWDLRNGLPINDTDDGHTIAGTAGNDIINGRGGNDYISGGDGNDSIDGGTGNDQIWGEKGNDILTGGAGIDNVSGGAGDDTYVFRAGDSAKTAGGEQIWEDVAGGVDTIKLAGGILPGDVRMWADANGWLNIQYSANDLLISKGSETINGSTFIRPSAIEKIAFDNGTVWDLTAGLPMTDTDDAHEIHGASGSDIIDGRGGDDYIDGGAGNDTISGGTGNDMLYGGSGTDTLTYAGATAAVAVDLSKTAAQNTVGAGIDTVSGFENLTGSGYNDTLTGNAGANVINGGNGNDTVQGGAGNDTLKGGAGTDTLSYSAAASAVTVDLSKTAAQATGGAGTDTVTGFENLTGSAYNDTLTGNASANTIQGGNGNDTINGGGGNDVLYGGAGADRFVFQPGGGVDTITDFSKTQKDVLDISGLLTGYNPLTSAITDFVQITTSGTNSIVKVDANGGANSFVQIATITGVTGLTDEAALLASGHLLAA